MIKIVQKEITETYCDGCGDRLEWGHCLETDFYFGYDSNKDGLHGKFQYCADCAEIIWGFIEEKWPDLKLNDQD